MLESPIGGLLESPMHFVAEEKITEGHSCVGLLLWPLQCGRPLAIEYFLNLVGSLVVW